MKDDEHGFDFIDSDRHTPLIYGHFSPEAQELQRRACGGERVSEIASPESWRRFVLEECGGDVERANAAFLEIWPSLPPPRFELSGE